MNEPELKKTSALNSLSGKIESFSGNQAVIILSDGQKINWPVAELPANTEISSIVTLKLLNEETEELEREKLAKNILNEILK